MVLTVVIVQIKGLLGNCAASGGEECGGLRDEWLLGCTKNGVAAVGAEVGLLPVAA